ncbi:hypothetical protein Q3G72_026882 [Acer saccharum]|nr:hypothetical protein Q3G72_026882 [Acer saccharum]
MIHSIVLGRLSGSLRLVFNGRIDLHESPGNVRSCIETTSLQTESLGIRQCKSSVRDMKKHRPVSGHTKPAEPPVPLLPLALSRPCHLSAFRQYIKFIQSPIHIRKDEKTSLAIRKRSCPWNLDSTRPLDWDHLNVIWN